MGYRIVSALIIDGPIEGDLDLSGNTSITALPDGLSVGGYLDLQGCAGITALPDGLSVGGYLDLHGTGITVVPKKLEGKIIR